MHRIKQFINRTSCFSLIFAISSSLSGFICIGCSTSLFLNNCKSSIMEISFEFEIFIFFIGFRYKSSGLTLFTASSTIFMTIRRCGKGTRSSGSFTRTAEMSYIIFRAIGITRGSQSSPGLGGFKSLAV